MKITVNNETKSAIKYPWVGRAPTGGVEDVVLFTEKDTGICLYSTHASHTSTTEARVAYGWEESNFIPCSITLDSTTNMD